MSRIISAISATDGIHQLPVPKLGPFTFIPAAQFNILYGVALNLICAFYIIFFVFVVKNTFTTASSASVFIFLAVFYILLFSAIGMLYYCIISSLVQWIKIARGLAYDGNGLPVKNWNFK